eukprot:scaffold49985_cov70-Cyclotella_meneghiniana.AAC.6
MLPLDPLQRRSTPRHSTSPKLSCAAFVSGNAITIMASTNPHLSSSFSIFLVNDNCNMCWWECFKARQQKNQRLGV